MIRPATAFDSVSCDSPSNCVGLPAGETGAFELAHYCAPYDPNHDVEHSQCLIINPNS